MYVASPAFAKVAVYVVPEPLNELSVPALTVISPATKLEVASLDVKVRLIEPSLLVSPEFTVVDVIAIVGDVPSRTRVWYPEDDQFHAASTSCASNW